MLAMKDRTALLFWTPRIIALIYIMLLSLFALDVFVPGKTILQYTAALIAHLLPQLLLIILLLIAWYNNVFIGALFIMSYLLFFFFFYDKSHVLIQALLFSPLFILGVIFLVSQKSSSSRHVKTP